MSDAVAGHLMIGTTGQGEVVMNLPKPQVMDQEGNSHYVFSPNQARRFGKTMITKAREAAAELDPKAPKTEQEEVDRKLQKLIDIMFQAVMVSAHHLHGKADEEIAAWLREQLRECGFPTQPRGCCWGVLVDSSIPEETAAGNVAIVSPEVPEKLR